MKQCNAMWAFRLLPMGAVFLTIPAAAAAGEDQATVAKDSVQVTAYTISSYRKNDDIWSWVPRTGFRVNGPIPSGGQLYMEFHLPGAAVPVKFDCKTLPVLKGYVWKTDCGGRSIPEDKASTYTGAVNFSIHLRNELAGTDATLFTGKTKIAKAHSRDRGPKAANHFVYYVDHDWNMPIGYIFLTPSDAGDWKLPELNAAFWYRGSSGLFEPHLFYQGKEVGRITFEGEEVGKASCSDEVQNSVTHYVDDSLPQKAQWSRVKCLFGNVHGWNKTGKTASLRGMVGDLHVLSANPGEYEIKILWKNHLARSIKFTVGPDGKFDNGIAAANNLGSDRAIIPVQVIGGEDGTWNREAWKTEAFYANPLKGFTPVQ